MTYSEACGVAPGAVLRTDWGDVGEVVGAFDTSLPVIFTLWRKHGPALLVHSSHAWRLPAPRPVTFGREAGAS